QAGVLGLLDGRRALAETYDDVHARVLQVLGVCVALRAEADDGHGLAVEEGEVCVVVVEHRTAESMTSDRVAASRGVAVLTPRRRRRGRGPGSRRRPPGRRPRPSAPRPRRATGSGRPARALPGAGAWWTTWRARSPTS